MPRKRKRAGLLDHNGSSLSSRCQRPRLTADNAVPASSSLSTLRLYYTTVCSLRQYLLSKLPRSAQRRRRRLATAGLADRHGVSSAVQAIPSTDVPGDSSLHCSPQTASLVAEVLDGTYVGTNEKVQQLSHHDIERHFAAFSQQRGSKIDSSAFGGDTSMSDIVDFVIWLLFYRIYHNAPKPPHLLCPGFQRAQPPRPNCEDRYTVAGLPGLTVHYPNGNVNVLKAVGWEMVPKLLGAGGDKIMLDMLLQCGLFAALSSGVSSLSQISGAPLPEQQPLVQNSPKSASDHAASYTRESEINPPASIHFVRSRTFHGRPALNAKGNVTFGLRHIHALQRYPNFENRHQTVHLMKYIFPRQFGLHNVFTSRVDRNETTQPFKDYTLREQEIDKHDRNLQQKGRAICTTATGLPKRLRGQAFELVQKLQRNARKCSYAHLLNYYCARVQFDGPNAPKASQRKQSQARTRRPDLNSSAARHTGLETSNIRCTGPRSRHGRTSGIWEQQAVEASSASVTDLATPHAQVSAFCRRILSELIPNRFWGVGCDGEHNKRTVMKDVENFIRLRRFETMSLHHCSQHLKTNAMTWLDHPGSRASKLAISDFKKRSEIFLEFLYYVFDSLLIPLIRSNFHVTESTAHQNRLFYFRLDVWRDLTEPAMAQFKASMYKEIPLANAKRLLDSRDLGICQVRMIPKASGLRPIMNLRRRMARLYHGKASLERSINSVMIPVFNMLDLERKRQPEVLGGSLFSVGDMLPKLQRFRARVPATSSGQPRKLYFAKVDVKSCFDTIPQHSVLKVAASLVQEEEYRIARYAEIKSVRMHYCHADGRGMARPSKKFLSVGRAGTDFDDFGEWLEREQDLNRKHAVFVDGVVQRPHSTEKLLALLREHIQNNVFKFGKKYFRQRNGIPQGSILSSLLCSLYYAKLEQTHLGFLDSEDCVLLHLIDDFLVISTCRHKAQRFFEVMHTGLRDFGVEINPAKSLANFAATVHGHEFPSLPPGREAFPYCGNLINMRTLDITKDRDRRKQTALSDTLTIESSKAPGRTFYRKTLSAFKLQTQKMLVDTDYNQITTVLSTVYQNFCETAMKMSRYTKCMPKGGRPHLDLVIGTIRDLIDLAYVSVQAKQGGQAGREGWVCKGTIHRRQIGWLGCQAFYRVLSRKQTHHRETLAWLVGSLRSIPMKDGELDQLQQAVDRGSAVFRNYKY